MNPPRDLIIFTDLDGTLLDEETYSFAAAGEALELVSRHRIPLVFCTSKTRAELDPIRAEMANAHPFIVENGGGVYLPGDYFAKPGDAVSLADGLLLKSLGMELAQLIPELNLLKERLGVSYRGFSDMGAAEVAQLTGLDVGAAGHAKARRYTEPIVFQDNAAAWRRFASALDEAGIEHRSGGRFIHLSRGGDKRRAMSWLLERYSANGSPSLTTLALGDSENDIGMLAAADLPVVVNSRRNPLRHVPGRDDVVFTTEYGPRGWNRTVTAIIRGRDLDG